MSQYIVDLNHGRRLRAIGSKAQELRRLHKKGFAVPPSYVCVWDAYERYLVDDIEIVERIRSELIPVIQEGRHYVVRSSANLEDSLEHSFAGQFKSVLNVEGIDDVIQAIWSIWASTRSPGVEKYLAQMDKDPQDLKMAVIIQEMVSPVVSGVAFSKNPMTGMDEIVVEAVEGSGESLMREGATPGRWINKWGVWTLKPEQETIPLSLIEKVVTQTKTITDAFDVAVDLEWVYDGEVLYWVQLREITTLENINVYSNHISKEFLPGIIKPLVWSINVPLVNGAWVWLLTEMIGNNDIDPYALAKAFYYRAYFNMGVMGEIFSVLGLPRESLELLMGLELEGAEKPSFRPSWRTFLLLPRMVGFVVGKLRFRRRVEAWLPGAQARYQAFDAAEAATLDAPALIEEIDKLYTLNQRTAYYNIVVPLLMQIYNQLFKRQLKSAGIAFEALDITAGLAELEAYDPNVHLRRLHEKFLALAPQLQTKIKTGDYAAFRELEGVGSLRDDVRAFIDHFGHLSDSGNDFSFVPWSETPDVVLTMITGYGSPEADDASVDEAPVEASDADSAAPSTPGTGRSGKQTFDALPLPAVRRALLTPIYRRARTFRLYREMISFLYTYGNGLFRRYFFLMGRHLADKGLIEMPEDVFYLYYDEVKALVAGDHVDGDAAAKVVARKQEIASYQNIVPPSTIYGDDPVPIEVHVGRQLKGTPTSSGNYQGRVKVVQGIQEFGKLERGDVLVIPYSDVGWTPLFAKAGAVVAESGGMLSHSSIVAREYGIPAVVSVIGACQLEDNTLVTVDGYEGKVIIHS